MVFPFKGRIKTPPVTGCGDGLSQATPRPRCHKKLVPRRSVDAINVEVDERLGGRAAGGCPRGLGLEVLPFFFGGISRGLCLFANQSWDVVFFLLVWMWMEREVV